MVREEEKYFPSLIKWLKESRGFCCQAKGPLKGSAILPTEIDVVGCRVHFKEEDLRPYFEGHVIEVKCGSSSAELRDLLSKIKQDVHLIKEMPNTLQILTRGGKIKVGPKPPKTFTFSSLYCYIALPSDLLLELPPWFLDELDEKVGILGLRKPDDRPIVEREPKPQWEMDEPGKGYPWGPSDYTSFGTLGDQIRWNPILHALFHKLDDAHWFQELRRRKSERDKRDAIKGAIGYVKKEEAASALHHLIGEIETKLPQLERDAAGQCLYYVPPKTARENCVLQIKTKNNDFDISFGFKAKSGYRVRSKGEITSFEDGGVKYKGDLQVLINSVLIPRIKERLSPSPK